MEEDKLIKVYKNVRRVFVGKSPLNEMTKFSAGHGKRFDGNSILLELPRNKHSYAHIGSNIFEFETTEPITEFVSPVGNSDVPYPVALSDNYIYFLAGPNKVETFFHKMARDELPKCLDLTDPYGFYYDIEGKLFSTFVGPLKRVNVKMIRERIWQTIYVSVMSSVL